MSALAATNPPGQQENKSARKKKVKANPSTSNHQESPAQEDKPDVEAPHINGADGSAESPYLKELSKNIRNLKKKLSANQKTDAVIAENPGKTLDELFAERKINADQKASAEKRPGLQASLEQLEHQYEHYQTFEEDSHKRFIGEKEGLQKAHEQELAQLRKTLQQEAEEQAGHVLQEKLLTLTRFLRAAAAKRSDENDTAEENMAFEGALLLVYGGDQSAVSAMQKLIDGSDDIVPTVEGQPSSFSFKHVRDASAQTALAAPAEVDAPPAEESPVAAQVDGGASGPQSDPTVINAGMTELDINGDVAGNDLSQPVPALQVPEASVVNAGAANATAEAHWDNHMSESMTSGPDGFEIVNKPSEPTDAENGVKPTPSASMSNPSWAEDVPNETPPAPSAANDGFHEVHHGRGRGRGGYGGDFRGRGRGARGDGYRGRGGYRGDGRGRGRGPRGAGRGRGGGPFGNAGTATAEAQH